mgnify:FL=1
MGLSLASVGRPFCRRAYAQACLMVHLLIVRIEDSALADLLCEFASRYATSGDSDESLEACFGVTEASIRKELREKIIAWNLSRNALPDLK